MLEEEKVSLEAQLRASQQRVEELTNTLADRAEEVEMLTDERDALVRERDALVDQRNALGEDLEERTAALEQQTNYNNYLQVNLAGAQEAMVELEDQLAEVQGQNEALQQQLQAALAPPEPDEEEEEDPEEIEGVSDVDYEEPAPMDEDPPARRAPGGAADP